MGDTGLHSAHVLDGRGGSRLLDWEGVRSWKPEDGPLWLHLDAASEATRRWLVDESGLDDVACESLLADDPRPRSVVRGDALLAVLRGVNVNPGADPEDMVALRLWIEDHRIVTSRRRRLMAVQDVGDALAAGSGPTRTGELLVELCDRLASRMAVVLSDLDDEVDRLEDEVLTAERYELRARLGEIRREAIGLRRYLAPQRDALSRLYTERVSWLTEMDRAYLREVSDRVLRYVEDIDSARERAAVAQDTLNGRLSEQMNRNLYVMSTVAAIFLPLGLLTGLLGINVGGMPGVDSPGAFAVVCVLLGALTAAEIWLFRRKKWL